MTSLIAQDLCKSYTSTSGVPLQILDGVSLTLKAGENTAIVGPSGSGKSTLLAILGTLEVPTSGTLRIGEVEPFSLAEAEMATFRSRQIGFVFQDHHLLPQCTVLENVLVPYLAAGTADKSAVEHAEALLQRVGLAERRLHRPAQLSGGERQRVAIARALVRQPALVLADEPTGNLDSATANVIANLFIELQQELSAILIVVTHSQELAEKMQRQLRLEDGHLV